MPAIKEVPPRTKYSNLPRELNFDTPITRSDFSPPPSCVDAIQLANHVESAITFDDDSEMMSSQKSSNESLTEVELQVEETVDDNTPLNLNIVSKDVHADESDAQVEPLQSEYITFLNILFIDLYIFIYLGFLISLADGCKVRNCASRDWM